MTTASLVMGSEAIVGGALPHGLAYMSERERDRECVWVGMCQSM